jgi:hypothetical protein
VTVGAATGKACEQSTEQTESMCWSVCLQTHTRWGRLCLAHIFVVNGPMLQQPEKGISVVAQVAAQHAGDTEKNVVTVKMSTL